MSLILNDVEFLIVLFQVQNLVPSSVEDAACQCLRGLRASNMHRAEAEKRQKGTPGDATRCFAGLECVAVSCFCWEWSPQWLEWI